MKKLLICGVAAFVLSGCTTANTQDIQQGAQNAIADTSAVTGAGVAILTDVANALTAALAPIKDIVGIAGAAVTLF